MAKRGTKLETWTASRPILAGAWLARNMTDLTRRKHYRRTFVERDLVSRGSNPDPRRHMQLGKLHIHPLSAAETNGSISARLRY